MTYPQPNANQYATSGGGFFRLNTKLVSAGDIYESEQGAHGFAIGPDSDISKVNIAYFDPQQAQNQSQVLITPNRPFPGFVQAANSEGLYIPSNRPGRILIWPDEIYNASFTPEPAVSSNGRVDIEVPVLDVVEYFAPGPATPGRNNKTYYVQNIPFPGNGLAWYWVLPFYGRRYASIQFQHPGTGGFAITLSVVGVNYIYSDDSGYAGTEEELVAPTAVAAYPSLYQGQVLASTMGMFDAIYIKLLQTAGGGLIGSAATPLKVVVSDSEV